MSLTVLLAVAFVGAALYYVCPLRLRWVLLLLLSYGFYLTCGLSALPFIALTTLTTWAGALVIARVGESGKAYLREHKAELTAEAKKAQKARTRSRQRVWFFAVLLLNFGVLAVLKYLNPVMAWGASLLGGSAPSLGLVLPLGISFYTFQSMGYLIDVYNGKYAPEKNPAKFALFVSFFPQLIQGPIARFDQLESQLITPHRFGIADYAHQPHDAEHQHDRNRKQPQQSHIPVQEGPPEPLVLTALIAEQHRQFGQDSHHLAESHEHQRAPQKPIGTAVSERV